MDRKRVFSRAESFPFRSFRAVVVTATEIPSLSYLRNTAYDSTSNRPLLTKITSASNSSRKFRRLILQTVSGSRASLFQHYEHDARRPVLSFAMVRVLHWPVYSITTKPSRSRKCRASVIFQF